MKKILAVAIVFAFGFVFQTQAASSNANQGIKQGQSSSQTQGSQSGNAVQTEEQNKVKNQGESTQVQTQEQNEVQTQAQDSPQSETGSGEISPNVSTQNRSRVTSAIRVMLQIAERNEEVGQQLRVIAQNQTQNQLKMDQSVSEIENRSGFMKFLAGPDYEAINNTQLTLDQNKEQIRELNQIRTRLENSGDQQQLAEQIKVLEQANQGIETFLASAQGGFSLFGWLVKLFS